MFGDNPNTSAPSFNRQTDNFSSSQSDTPVPEFPNSASLGLSSFSLNLNDDDAGGSSSEQLIRVKTAKLKKKLGEGLSTIVETIIEENQQLREILQQGSSNWQQNLELQVLRAQNEAKRLALKELKEKEIHIHGCEFHHQSKRM